MGSRSPKTWQHSQQYELHIYTMGTRAYAENIAKIIDPERKIFGERILSRDESGSMTAERQRGGSQRKEYGRKEAFHIREWRPAFDVVSSQRVAAMRRTSKRHCASK